MRVLLSTLAIEADSRNDNNRNAAYPLGLAYLHSTLEASGHKVKTLFLNNYDESYSEGAFFRAVEEFTPEVAGFQIFSMNRTATFAAMEKLRSRYPEIKIVIGGVHASIMTRQILERFGSSVAVIGEGEKTFPELLEAFAGKRTLESVDGLAYNKGGTIVFTRPRDLIEDLDSLPPAEHGIFFENEPGRTVGHVISSRGCPYDCSFCCLKVISKRKYRARSIQLVVNEIKALKQKYPRLSEIQFHDDTFLLDNVRVIEFCKLIVAENLGLTFTCSARVKPVSAEMFDWMEKAGFSKIMFGLETGSPKLLDSIHKKISRDDVLSLFRLLKGRRFTVTTFLMCGFPGETDGTVRETIELVRATQRIHYNWVAGVGKLWVYPGTEVYEVMKKSGKISDDYWLSDKPVPYFTVEHDLPALVRFEEKLMENLSFLRIFTIRGFMNHFLSMPAAIIRALVNASNRKLLLTLLAVTARRCCPGAYSRLYAFYRGRSFA